MLDNSGTAIRAVGSFVATIGLGRAVGPYAWAGRSCCSLREFNELIRGGMVFVDIVDDALTEIYLAQYDRLIRIANALLDDTGTSEEVVQDAYVRVLHGWAQIRDPQAAAAYLRTTVLNLARSRMRRRLVEAKHAPEPPPDVPPAEDSVIALLERERVLLALRTLPRRQRECLVLRYYRNLSEPQIAAALGISAGAVKSHTSRGISALRRRLDQPQRPTERWSGKPHRDRAA